jgi:hypothetical protein
MIYHGPYAGYTYAIEAADLPLDSLLRESEQAEYDRQWMECLAEACQVRA